MPLKVNHLFIPYLALLGFLMGGILASGGIPWYSTLTLPSYHPTLATIAFIWALIFLCGAWSLLILWNDTTHDSRLRRIFGYFGVVMALNAAWSVAFFSFHLLAFSVGLALIIGLAALALAAGVMTRSVIAGLLILPYAVWVIFASFLTYQVLLLNV